MNPKPKPSPIVAVKPALTPPKPVNPFQPTLIQAKPDQARPNQATPVREPKPITPPPSPARAELTLKFSIEPAVELARDNQVVFVLEAPVLSSTPVSNTQMAHRFRVRIAAKKWRKFLEAKRPFAEWVATVGGKLGPKVDGAFDVLEAGLQVFERKPKEAPAVAATPLELAS